MFVHAKFRLEKQNQIKNDREIKEAMAYNDIVELSTHDEFQHNVNPCFTSHHLL